MFNKKGRIFLPILLFALLIILAWLIPIKTELVLSDKNGTVLKVIDVASNQDFEISFKHSVNKGIVREKYHINSFEDSFYLQTGWFESYGAGMLDQIPEDVKMSEDGQFLRLDFPQKNLSSVSYAAAGFAGHKLQLADTVIDFFELNPYKTIIIKVKHRTLISMIF